jgi:hypothetical protein
VETEKGFTVDIQDDKGQSDMKPVQETTPEQILTWTAEELNEFEVLLRICIGDAHITSMERSSGRV